MDKEQMLLNLRSERLLIENKIQEVRNEMEKPAILRNQSKSSLYLFIAELKRDLYNIELRIEAIEKLPS